ncbi:MAG: AI-2E family transporter [Fimbriimonadaceae bacterium]
MEQRQLSDAIYKALAKGIYLAVALLLLVAFVDAIAVILLFFLMAIVFAIGLSPLVNWLEGKGVPRAVAAILVMLGIAGIAAGVVALVIPRVSREMEHFSGNLRQYGTVLSDRIETVVGKYPEIEEQLKGPALKEKVDQALGSMVGRIGRYSLGAVTAAVGLLVLVTLIMYMLARPRPLLRGLIMIFPPGLRERFVIAYSRGAQGVVNWVWANALIGGIEGVLTGAFLSVLGIPGAITWGVVTFFAELIPQLGSYIMAIPPLIVTIAVDPSKAIWVLLWFILLQQAVNNFIAPPIRSSAMNIHPVSELFAVLALTMAFGLFGAVIASPVVVFTKAFYDCFYSGRQAPDPTVDEKVEAMLARDAEYGHAPTAES